MRAWCGTPPTRGHLAIVSHGHGDRTLHCALLPLLLCLVDCDNSSQGLHWWLSPKIINSKCHRGIKLPLKIALNLECHLKITNQALCDLPSISATF